MPAFLETTAARTIDRVESHLHLGADSQVDDRNVIVTPMQPERTDPFPCPRNASSSTPPTRTCSPGGSNTPRNNP